MSKTKSPLQTLVFFQMKSTAYPQWVKKFLRGLYATLYITHDARAADMEKLVFYAYRNGYELGAAAYGGDAQKIHDGIPTLGLDEDNTKDRQR
jgi:hypothetical protein